MRLRESYEADEQRTAVLTGFPQARAHFCSTRQTYVVAVIIILLKLALIHFYYLQKTNPNYYSNDDSFGHIDHLLCVRCFISS